MVDDRFEARVRAFLAAWAEPSTEELASYFAADATWSDGPQGIRTGRDPIAQELADQLRMAYPMQVEIVTLVGSGATVMVEWRGSGLIGGRPISTSVMAVFEFDDDLRIRRFSECYDLGSLMDQLR